VPAVEQSFVTTLPDRLYMDSNVCTAYLVMSHAHDARAARLLQSLQAHGSTTLYISDVNDFASFDAGCRRVDGLQHWTDRLHDRAAPPSA